MSRIIGYKITDAEGTNYLKANGQPFKTCTSAFKAAKGKRLYPAIEAAYERQVAKYVAGIATPIHTDGTHLVFKISQV